MGSLGIPLPPLCSLSLWPSSGRQQDGENLRKKKVLTCEFTGVCAFLGDIVYRWARDIMFLYHVIQNSCFCCACMCQPDKHREQEEEKHKRLHTKKRRLCEHTVSLIMMALRGWECLQNNIHEVRGWSIWIWKEPRETKYTHTFTYVLLFPRAACEQSRVFAGLNKYLPACRRCMCMYVSVFTAGFDLLTICEGLNNMQRAASHQLLGTTPHLKLHTRVSGNITRKVSMKVTNNSDIQTYINVFIPLLCCLQKILKMIYKIKCKFRKLRSQLKKNWMCYWCR